MQKGKASVKEDPLSWKLFPEYSLGQKGLISYFIFASWLFTLHKPNSTKLKHSSWDTLLESAPKKNRPNHITFGSLKPT